MGAFTCVQTHARLFLVYKIITVHVLFMYRYMFACTTAMHKHVHVHMRICIHVAYVHILNVAHVYIHAAE